MSDRHHEERKVKLSGRFVRFIQKYRLFFVILAAAVLITPIAVYVIETIRQKNAEAAAAVMFEVEKKYDEYDKSTEADKKAALEKELFALIDNAADRFGDQFTGAKALLIRADLNYQKVTGKDAADKKAAYVSAVQDLLRAADRASENFLTPLALKKAAEAIQNLPKLLPGETGGEGALGIEEVLKLIPARFLEQGAVKISTADELSLKLYQYIVENYRKSMYAAEALINTGFIFESQSKWKEAGEVYTRMESEFSANDWTKLAINRKLKLQADGVLSN